MLKQVHSQPSLFLLVISCGHGSQIRHVPYRDVIHHRIPDGLDQDHRGQRNAPSRAAFSQLAKREVHVARLQLNELDPAGQVDQVPDR